MGGPRTGSLIGAIGGVVFVLVNAGVAGGPGSVALRVLGVAAFAVVLWFSVLRRAAHRPGPAPAPRALRTYLVCVVGEVVAIPLGAQVLTRLVDRPGLVLPWVVVVLGVHFVPFARAFGVRLFTVLAWTLVAVGVLGGALTLAVDPRAAAWSGVVAGFVLLAFAAAGGTRATRRRGTS